jgi:chemotaxis protein methyltransferase CheR
MKKQGDTFQDYIDAVSEYSELDLSSYSVSVNKKLISFIESERIGSASELKMKLNSDRMFHMKLLEGVTIRYTEVFRDPDFFISLRNQVLPYLSTFSSINIWVAGCSTGEEVYSLAILPHEYDMLDQATIFATDINQDALRIAENGIYHPARIREYSVNYTRSGGKKFFGRYYSLKDDMIVMNENLKKKIQFDRSDLLKDEVKGKFNLVLCRNVLYYFTDDSQKEVISTIARSIRNYGYFATGLTERISTENVFSCIDQANKIYRKVI